MGCAACQPKEDQFSYTFTPAKYSHVHCSVQKRLHLFFRCWMKVAHSKKIGQTWADHIVERVVQEQSKRRGGRFHPELDRSSRHEKIDRIRSAWSELVCFPSLKLPQSKNLPVSSYSQVVESLNQQEILINKSSGGNSAAEIHSKNLCRSNDVVIIWKFCGGNPQRESP